MIRGVIWVCLVLWLLCILRWRMRMIIIFSLVSRIMWFRCLRMWGLILLCCECRLWIGIRVRMWLFIIVFLVGMWLVSFICIY